MKIGNTDFSDDLGKTMTFKEFESIYESHIPFKFLEEKERHKKLKETYQKLGGEISKK